MKLKISSFASTGKGVGTIRENDFLRPVFVLGAIPGDICDVEIIKKYKKYYEAKLISVITPSSYRQNPLCDVFGDCGACDWLHVDYMFQLESKKQILSFLLSKLKIDIPDIKIVPCDDNLHYRDKVRIQFQNGKAGFYKNKSNDLVFPTRCYIINDSFNNYFNKKTNFSGEQTFVFDYKTKKSLFEESSKPSYNYGDIKFNFGLNSFIQSNLKQNKKLIDLVLSLVKSGSVLELYSGMGNFSLPLAKYNSCDVVAVEGNEEAVDYLKLNMKNNCIDSIKSINEDVRKFLLSVKESFDYVLLDPPRIGVDDKQSLEKIAKITDNIVYVACDPNSLVKDLKKLLSLGFEIESIYIVDMFPQTHHFETVVLLRKRQER